MSVSAPLRLRPLEIGDLLDETFRMYRRHFVLFAGISAILSIPSAALFALLLGSFSSVLQQSNGAVTDFSFLAPLLAASIQARGVDGAPLFALCLAGHAASRASTDIPVGNNDVDIHCKLCVQGGPTYAETPSLGTAWTPATTGTSLRWAVADNPVLDSVDLIGEHARGPPLLS